jgi:hypothetical protein
MQNLILHFCFEFYDWKVISYFFLIAFHFYSPTIIL